MLIYREDAMNKNKQIIQNRKGACENNHKFFRCIVPKGTSIDRYMQSNMTLAQTTSTVTLKILQKPS